MGSNGVQHEGHEADAIADRGHRGEGHRKQKTKVQVFAFLSWFQNIFNHYGEADSWIKIIISKPIIIQNK